MLKPRAPKPDVRTSQDRPGRQAQARGLLLAGGGLQHRDRAPRGHGAHALREARVGDCLKADLPRDAFHGGGPRRPGESVQEARRGLVQHCDLDHAEVSRGQSNNDVAQLPAIVMDKDEGHMDVAPKAARTSMELAGEHDFAHDANVFMEAFTPRGRLARRAVSTH